MPPHLDLLHRGCLALLPAAHALAARARGVGVVGARHARQRVTQVLEGEGGRAAMRRGEGEKRKRTVQGSALSLLV
jgi:hypothetical protein